MSSLPPLPEVGPVEETTVLKESEKSTDSFPKAESSSLEKTEVVGKGVKRHRLMRSGMDEGTADSASSPVRDVSALARRSPTPSPHQSGFGGPRFDVDLSSEEDEQR